MDRFTPHPAAGIAGKGAEGWKGKMSSCSGTHGGATQPSGFKQVERAKFSFMTCCKPRELWNKAKKGVYSNKKIPIPSSFHGNFSARGPSLRDRAQGVSLG